MLIQPYLYFDGRADEALDFYKKVLGAEVIFLMRFSEAPPEACGGRPMPPGDKIMHATFKVGDSVLMASDGDSKGQAKFEGISLSVQVKDAAEAERIFNALAEGGKIQMPMMQTFFSPRFGMVADKFGVSWMVIVEHKM